MNQICNKCDVALPLHKFYKNIRYSGGIYKTCKSCHSAHHIKRLKTNHQYRLWFCSKENAKKKGIPHTIRPHDILLPEVCIYLGIKLNYEILLDEKRTMKYDYPSIDRIDSTKGYTIDNIQIISLLANRIKNNATPEQLITFSKNVLRMNGYDVEE